MKKILVVMLLINCSVNCFSQEHKFPDGVYLNIEQLKQRTPAFNADLQVIHRTQGDIGFNGGNDYELKSDVDSLDKKYIKKTIYAYVKKDSLFINGIQHQIGTWYALCLTHGIFLTFKGAMSDKNMNEVSSSGVAFGAIGGAIGGASAAKKRFLYVFSLRTGNVRPLKKEYLTERLKDDATLSDQFNKEKDPDSDSTLVKYINLLNEKIALDSINK
jgi:hypothetical protein